MCYSLFFIWRGHYYSLFFTKNACFQSAYTASQTLLLHTYYYRAYCYASSDIWVLSKNSNITMGIIHKHLHHIRFRNLSKNNTHIHFSKYQNQTLTTLLETLPRLLRLQNLYLIYQYIFIYYTLHPYICFFSKYNIS